MSVTDFQQWMGVAKELGYEGDELKKFVNDRQVEAREERARQREEEKERRLMEEKKESEQRRIEEEKEKRSMEEEKEKRHLEERKESEARHIEFEIKKLESEIRLKEVEARTALEMKQMEENKTTKEGDKQPTSSENRGKGAQNIKFPMFRESDDCLDGYLIRFERTAEAFEIPKQLWSLTLARYLEGQALQVYQRLTPTQAKDYDCLKEQLLKRFRLTEGGYRRKFKESRIEVGETPSQFVERLRRYVQQWILLAGYERTYEGLESLILKDQFFVTCSPDLRMFIKEKGKTSLDDMLTHAEAYIEAHGYKQGEAMARTKPKFMDDRDRNRIADVNGRNKFGSTWNKFKGGNGWSFAPKTSRLPEKDDKREGMQMNDKSLVCYVCKGTGHKSFQCPNRAKGFVKQTAAAIRVHESNPTKKKTTQHEVMETQRQESAEERVVVKENEQDREGENVVTGSAISDDVSSEKEDMKRQEVKVNGEQVECLYDSGATCCVVQRRLVKESDLTGKKSTCTLIDGTVRRFPTAKIMLDGEFVKGEIEALVTENPVKPIIMGRVRGVKYIVGKDEEERPNNADVNDDMSNRRDPIIEDELNKEDGSSPQGEPEPEVTAVVETRAMSGRNEKYRPLKIFKLPDLNVSPREMRELQECDDTLKKYRELAMVNNDTEEHEIKVQFMMKNDLLYRCYREPLKKEVRMELMVPKGLREKVMAVAHCSLLAAHFGTKKTLEKISGDFYWPSINQDVRRFVLSCDICQRTVDKKVNYKAPLGHLPIVDVPFACICIDLIGPMNPMSSRGHRYVLTAVDMSTRYPEAILLKGISAEEVSEALFGIYCRMGVPQRIHTDRGSQFTSDLMAEVNEMLLVKHTMTSPYHAMGNGCVERLNGTIKATLRKLIHEQPKEWERYLAPLLFALRDAVHESHGFTPFELMFGRSCRGPTKILKELWTKEIEENEVK